MAYVVPGVARYIFEGAQRYGALILNTLYCFVFSKGMGLVFLVLSCSRGLAVAVALVVLLVRLLLHVPFAVRPVCFSSLILASICRALLVYRSQGLGLTAVVLFSAR